MNEILTFKLLSKSLLLLLLRATRSRDNCQARLNASHFVSCIGNDERDVARVAAVCYRIYSC